MKHSDKNFELNIEESKPNMMILAPHNFRTWSAIRQVFMQRDIRVVSFEDLVDASKDHTKADGTPNSPAGFVAYAIKSGWLVDSEPASITKMQLASLFKRIERLERMVC